MANNETNKKDKTKTQKVKRPIDKRKIIQNAVIIVIIVAMLLSVGASVIYYWPK